MALYARGIHRQETTFANPWDCLCRHRLWNLIHLGTPQNWILAAHATYHHARLFRTGNLGSVLNKSRNSLKFKSKDGIFSMLELRIIFCESANIFKSAVVMVLGPLSRKISSRKLITGMGKTKGRLSMLLVNLKFLSSLKRFLEAGPVSSELSSRRTTNVTQLTCVCSL